jgi:hypothetical protein
VCGETAGILDGERRRGFLRRRGFRNRQKRSARNSLDHMALLGLLHLSFLLCCVMGRPVDTAQL